MPRVFRRLAKDLEVLRLQQRRVLIEPVEEYAEAVSDLTLNLGGCDRGQVPCNCACSGAPITGAM
jgi:hypothetical protein